MNRQKKHDSVILQWQRGKKEKQMQDQNFKQKYKIQEVMSKKDGKLLQQILRKGQGRAEILVGGF